MKFKQVGEEKIVSPQTVFFNLHKNPSEDEIEKKKPKRKASSLGDYSLKLGIIRSQTWFTPCSSLIVLKSSVTRRRMPAKTHIHVNAEDALTQ